MLFMNRSRSSSRWRCSCGIKRCVLGVAICTVLFASIFGSSSSCDFPAIYNFGDSNSDTGAASAAFTLLQPPNGRTYFGKPSGRHSDGRLMIDFIAEKLGLPFLSPYLDSIESNFRHGANFAASGSTAQPADAKILGAGLSPFSLNIQLSQFKQLKARTNEIYNTQGSLIKSSLPRPDEFSKALYTLDSGQNDLHFALTTMSEKQAKASIPNIVDQYAFAIETLYKEGARMFWIHNTGPIGCLPTFVVQSPPKPGEGDEIGCIKSYNEAAEEFNRQLKDKNSIHSLNEAAEEFNRQLVDIYTAKYSLISNAKKNGFSGPFNYCCGHLGEPEVHCWSTKVMNGTEIYPDSCSKPWKYISWDSIHYTEAANHWVAEHIMDGSLSDPSVPINKACQGP